MARRSSSGKGGACYFAWLLALWLCVAGAGEAVAARPLMVGHRGCCLGVENTARAFSNGADIFGYDGLECDVRVTADKQYVICHDEDTRRLGGNLVVAEATLDQLLAETLTQTRDGHTYTARLCTVDEFLDICALKNVFPIIELKWSTGINNNDMSAFDGLLQLVESRGLSERAIFLTSMRGSLEYIRRRHPELRCQWLCRDNWREHLDWCLQWGLTPSVAHPYLTVELAEAFASMKEVAASFDYDSLTYILDSLAGYELPRDAKERYRKIKAAAEAPDWEALGKLLE